MNLQSFYDNVCNSLRTYGNPYGSTHTRGWSWVNPQNTAERCAISRFIEGNNDTEVNQNLRRILGLKASQDLFSIDLVGKVAHMFDYYPQEINCKVRLEYNLKKFADQNELVYTDVNQSIKQDVKEEVCL